MRLLLAFTLLPLACRTIVSVDPTPRGGHVTSADGVRIAYTARGVGSPALVLVHGWMGDQNHWRRQADALSKDQRVVTLDLGGHGVSDADRYDWSFEALAGDVEAVVDELALDRVVLVGHSMGAIVALEAAQRMPDRVAMVVAVDSLHDAERELDLDTARALVEQLEGDYETAIADLTRSGFPPGADEVLVERLARRAALTRQDVAVALVAAYVGYDLGAALAATPVPVHAINADLNETRLETNREYKPDFELTVLPGLGHWLMIEDAKTFNETLRAVLAAQS